MFIFLQRCCVHKRSSSRTNWSTVQIRKTCQLNWFHCSCSIDIMSSPSSPSPSTPTTSNSGGIKRKKLDDVENVQLSKAELDHYFDCINPPNDYQCTLCGKVIKQTGGGTSSRNRHYRTHIKKKGKMKRVDSGTSDSSQKTLQSFPQFPRHTRDVTSSYTTSILFYILKVEIPRRSFFCSIFYCFNCSTSFIS